MSGRHRYASWVLLALVFCTGCLQSQLRKTTIHQAANLSDIHQQQVMNNLAMFVYDPNSLPHFLVPNQSATSGSENGSLGAMFTDGKSSPFNLGGSRTMGGSFTLTPINDPHKLALMRCAYQTAVWNCGCGEVSTSCPSCEERFEEFYQGAHAHGGDNQRCLDKESHCFFKVGRKSDVPKNCPGEYVGHFNGTYVWVDREGRDELVKLTLAILDFALYDAPKPQTRTVVRNVTKDAAGNVIGVSEQTTFSEPIEGKFRESRLSPSGSGFLQIQQQLQTLAPDNN